MEEKFVICDICGHKCRPRGIGAHKRLAHGIIERIVVTKVPKSDDLSEQGVLESPHESTTKVHLSDDLSDLSKPTIYKSDDLSEQGVLKSPHKSITDIDDMSTKVERGERSAKPSDYVKKKEQVVKRIILPVGDPDINRKVEELKELIGIELDLCDDNITPYVCSIDTPENRAYLINDIFMRVINGQATSVAGAIEDIEKEFNPNRIND